MKLLVFLISFWCPLTFAQSAYSPDGDKEQPLALYSYKPIYFLMGNPYTKIQVSLQTQIIKELKVYVGYSQTMIWDLFVNSPYFYDLNYNPLVWYRFNFHDESYQWIDLIPLEHESNGRGGPTEKSWNRAGVAYHRADKLGSRLKFYTDFKIWYAFNYNDHSQDLSQYRGLWELALTVSGLFDELFSFNDLMFRVYPGGPSMTDPTAGGQELTLRLRGGSSFLPLMVFQIFHGYGEYLQDYNVSHWGIRAGVGF